MPRFNKIRARRIRSHRFEDQEPSLSSIDDFRLWRNASVTMKNVPHSHGEESSSGVTWQLVARLAFHLTRRVSKNLASWRRTSNVSSCWKNNMMPRLPVFIGLETDELLHQATQPSSSPLVSDFTLWLLCLGQQLLVTSWYVHQLLLPQERGVGLWVCPPCGKIFDSCGNSRNPFSTGFPDEWLLKSKLLAEAEACCRRPSAF